jgi:pimeloyl-ACP methyl ester carboxylesterase
MSTPPITKLRHNRIDLAVHTLREGTGRNLLLLHGLGEHSPTAVPAEAAAWPGPVYALDFTGHGASDVPKGGGYSAEILLGDTDVTLAEIGPATVVGRGLGAYVALLLAGARPSLVRGAVLGDGPGLWGGPSGPTSSSVVVLEPTASTPDPYALYEMSRDLRPRDYAALFARLAVEHSGLAEPITVTAFIRPPWLDAVVDEVGVAEGTLASALATYARV